MPPESWFAHLFNGANVLSSKVGFLNFGTTEMGGWKGCTVRCRMFSNIPGHYPLDANSTFPNVTTKNVPRYWQCPLRTKTIPFKAHITGEGSEPFPFD